MLTQRNFTALLETLLSTAGVSYERRAVTAFVQSAWPMIEDDPCPERWAREFLDAATVAQLPE